MFILYSEITLKYFDKNFIIKYNGYWDKVESAIVNGEKRDTKAGI